MAIRTDWLGNRDLTGHDWFSVMETVNANHGPEAVRQLLDANFFEQFPGFSADDRAKAWDFVGGSIARSQAEADKGFDPAKLGLGFLGVGGVGGLTGAALTTGQDPAKAAMLDVAGLGAGVGLGASGVLAGGAAMPAAVPLSPAALGEMGLVEVSPGVWAAGGGAAGGLAGAAAGTAAAPSTVTGVGGEVGVADAGMDLGMFQETSNPYVLGASGSGTAEGLSAAAGGGAGTAVAGAGLGGYGPAIATGLGAGLPALLGYMGASKQSDAYQGLAQQYMAMGDPSRSRFEASFNPGFSMMNDPGYKDALDQTTKSFLHKASIAGNPADSPNAWTQTLKDVNSTFAYPALQNYRSMNANAGGLSRFADAAPGASSAAINADAGKYNAIGYGLGNIFNPPTSIEQLLKSMR